ncbi:MAG: bifunctional oligoribonuclease/PAP phosphatase NrnA, partial [Saprospiraceae bacterium]|nr:bifunctional oligoribonuclease/PAP phosphatase NrnA [Saprospiraceae bacterium]
MYTDIALHLMHSFDDFHLLFSSPQRVVIIPHLSPDADALGSSLALSHFLRKKGHTPTIVSPTVYPAFLAWMDESQEIVIADKEKQKAVGIVNDAEVLVFVDFSSYNRLKSL